MARKARVVLAGAPHHVYFRGNNRRRLFSFDRDRLLMIGCLTRAIERTGCSLHQLTLMTNHLHMIVTPPEATSLAAMVKSTCQRYAQQRNQRRDASGKLFEERYGSVPIRDEAQWMRTTFYADANAHLAKPERPPLEDRWSTGPLHAGLPMSRIPSTLWTPAPWYLRLGPDPESRAVRYRELVAGYLASKPRELLDPRERYDVEAYTRRTERPDGTSAREAPLRHSRKAKR